MIINMEEKTQMEIDKHFEELKSTFRSNRTRSLAYRLEQLQILKETLASKRQELYKALYEDLNMSEHAVELSFYLAVTDEVNCAISNLTSWAKPVKCETPLSLFPSAVSEQYEPLGTCLIIGSWNYPLTTVVLPLVSAIAAGNVAVVKPSESAVACSALMRSIVESLDQASYRCLEGGPETAKMLNKKPFDAIVFTGGTEIGKYVALDSARNLSKLVLELGGKNPVIVDLSCNLPLTIQRLVNGKFFNSGQTCVTADYIFVHKSISEIFIKDFIAATKELWGVDARENKSYGRIINQRHAERVLSYLEGEEKNIIFQAGTPDAKARFVPPTIVLNPSPSSRLHSNEIFGPIVYIMEFNEPNQVIDYILARDKPLQINYFGDPTNNLYKMIRDNTSSGGILVNDLLINYLCYSSGFGGVGMSGQGKIRGFPGFKELSNSKSIIERSRSGFMDIPMRYLPETPAKVRQMALISKLLGGKTFEPFCKKAAVAFLLIGVWLFLSWLIKKKILVINL